MKLAKTEQEILEGKRGQGAALAMKILVGIGEAFDARRMVPVTRAHVALSNQEADLWFAEKLVRAGATCAIPPTVNPGFCLDFFQEKQMGTGKDFALMQRTFDAYKTLGARLNFSCTPYLFDNIPRIDEIIAFSESSATPFVNSIWGARSNRESAQPLSEKSLNTGCSFPRIAKRPRKWWWKQNCRMILLINCSVGASRQESGTASLFLQAFPGTSPWRPS